MIQIMPLFNTINFFIGVQLNLFFFAGLIHTAHAAAHIAGRLFRSLFREGYYESLCCKNR